MAQINETTPSRKKSRRWNDGGALTKRNNALAKRANPTKAAAELAAEINNAHLQAEGTLRAAVEHAIRAGDLLLQAKRALRHGNWTAWCADNIKFSERLAQAYMRLARLPVEKRNAVADLPLREALSAIRSRQQKIADAEVRASRPPRSGRARVRRRAWEVDQRSGAQSQGRARASTPFATADVGASRTAAG